MQLVLNKCLNNSLRIKQLDGIMEYLLYLKLMKIIYPFCMNCILGYPLCWQEMLG